MPTIASVRSKLIAGAVITLVAVGVVPATAPYAAAAIVPVQGCTFDGAPLVIDVEDTTLGPYEGGWYALFDATGTAIDHSEPLGTATASPVCVLPVVDGALDSSQATWAFCTQPSPAFSNCVEDQLTEATAPFDADAAALAAWVIGSQVDAGDFSTAALEETQAFVQCITSDTPLPIPDFGDCEDFQMLLEVLVLPNLVDGTTELSVAATSTPGQFTVTSTMQIVDVAAGGDAGVELCAGQGGAELMAGQLMVQEPGTPVQVCVVDGGPTPTLVASSLYPELELGSFVGFDGVSDTSQPCAVFLTETGVGDFLTAQATSSAAPTPAPAPPATPQRQGSGVARTPARLSFAG